MITTFNIIDKHGLTSAQVAERVALGQVNRPLEGGWGPFAGILRRNTLTLFNFLVVPAAATLFTLNDWRGAWAVSVMAVTNSVLGIVHEIRAKRHLDRLTLLGETQVRVTRNGVEQSIPSGDVVMDDLIHLSPGDTIIADGLLVSASYLELDEALLTGESDSVLRNSGEQVKSGVVCLTGEATYIAQRVGSEAFAYRTAEAARRYQHTPGPTQQTLNNLVKWLTIIAAGLCPGYVGLYFVRGFPATDLVQMVAATITSLVPQGVVLLTTLTFVLAASRLGKKGAVIQQLMAVEGLAAVNVLCTDKTGTLTTGRQTLDRLETFAVPVAKVRNLLGTFAYSSIDGGNKSILALRDALKTGTHSETLDQLPFQSQNCCSAILTRIEGKKRLLVLGSFEVLGPHFSEAEKAPIEVQWRHLLPSGLRLIVFADGCGDNLDFRNGLPKVALRPLALVIFRDELRPNVANVLKSLTDQNIRVKVISGDHPETVRATVGSLGEVFKQKHVFTGDEWEASKDPSSAANHCDFFGRVSPEQKLALIRALQGSGHNVGMIGDGVNDILPIKRANFGVAMGTGSPATKAVAAMLLESNDFSVLPEVLIESRRVVQNVRVAAKLFLLKNAYTIALILVAVGFFGSPFPYLPQQVTLLNALTIGGPALIILGGRSSPIHAYGSSFFQDVGRFLWIAGGATSLASLFVFLGSLQIFGFDIEVARTMLLVTLIVAGLANAVIATRGNRSLVIWAVTAFCLLLAISAFPPTAYFFALASMTRLQWVVSLLGAVIAFAPTALLNANGAHANENRPPKANDPMHGGTSDSGSSWPREYATPDETPCQG